MCAPRARIAVKAACPGVSRNVTSPAGVETWVARAAYNQEMTVEAALTRDKHLAFQAFLNDPLMSLTTDKAWKLFNEMLKATKDMLPNWKT